MHPDELEKRLLKWRLDHCGVEVRSYLGMSGIGKCSLVLYKEMLGGRAWSVQDKLMCERGYAEEQRVLLGLAGVDGIEVGRLPMFPYEAFRASLDGLVAERQGLLGPGREFSDFGGKFLGHSDGSWAGALLEIKSVTADRLPEDVRLRRSHFWQVQTYMLYGGYEKALVIYLARDTGEQRVVLVRRKERIGEMARVKAAAVLEAVERRVAPGCDCGRCG